MTREPVTGAMLSVFDVADRLLVSERSVRRWIESGDLKAYRFGRSVRISEEDLANFIAASRRSMRRTKLNGFNT